MEIILKNKGKEVDEWLLGSGESDETDSSKRNQKKKQAAEAANEEDWMFKTFNNKNKVESKPSQGGRMESDRAINPGDDLNPFTMASNQEKVTEGEPLEPCHDEAGMNELDSYLNNMEAFVERDLL